MTRILVVSRGVHEVPDIGGADNLSYLYAKSASKIYDQVTFVGRGKADPEAKLEFIPVKSNIAYQSKYQTIYFIKGAMLSLIVTLKAIKYLLKKRVTLIHSNSSITTTIIKTIFPNIPVVYTIHDPLYCPQPNIKGLHKIERYIINHLLELRAAKLADRLIAVSDEIKSQLIENHLPVEKISTIYSTSTIQEVQINNVAQQSEIRASKYLLSVGIQNGRKRFDKIIGAMAFLPAEYKLVLVGNGPARSELQSAVNILGLVDRVTFIDYAHKSDLFSLYKNASLYLMVSEREGFPISIVESLFSGTKAMLFTNVERSAFSSIPESRFLFIHQGADTEFIAKKVLEFLDNESKKLDSPLDVISWARSVFPSLEGTGKSLQSIYEECAQAAPSYL